MHTARNARLYTSSALYTRLACGVAVSAISFAAAQEAYATPTGGTVVAGDASIIQNFSNTYITQTTE